MKLEKKIIQFRLAYSLSMYQQTEVDERHGSVSASTGRKSQKTVPQCFSDHKKPVADTFLSLSSVLPFPAPVVLSFRSRSTFRVAPRSALFTRQGPSKPPFSIPLRTVYFSIGTGLSFPTVDHLKQFMVTVLMINTFL